MLDRAQSDREPGATFALGDILFIDFESRGRHNLKVVGSDRYARSAEAIMLAWAFGDEPVTVTAVPDFNRALAWEDMPLKFRKIFALVEVGRVICCAHNASFDRSIWTHATTGFPELLPGALIDTRAQAAASGLPAALDDACKAIGLPGKDAAGRDWIKLFCLPDSEATPDSHPDEWAAFIDYARIDVERMRDVFIHTRQLPIAEWDEYWVAEDINARGIGVDIPFITGAARMAAIDRERSAVELSLLTNGAVGAVDQVKNMVAWLRRVLPGNGAAILVETTEEKDDEGVITKPAKWTLTRDRVVRLIAFLVDYLETQPHDEAARTALRVLEIRRYGGSKTPAKFGKMLQQQAGGVIRNQYVFSGAAQTGRFSARGIQIHNLARDTLPYEIDAIDALSDNTTYEQFARLGDDTPVARKLSLLIRPALVPDLGQVFVWGDWSNIEARLLPWLADDRDADARLEIFAAVDRDPSIPDIYSRTAAALSGIPVGEVTKKIRNRGKVVELACGFGGSTNALLNMAANYGMHIDPDEAKAFVYRWRDENQWAQRFWGGHDRRGASYGLWGALNRAMDTPGIYYPVGRVGYIFVKEYLGGSLLCRLPSGRFLTYRRIKWQRVEEKDDDGNIVDIRMELMFSREHGRVKLWPGLACENVVQATAADILRGTLVKLSEWPVRLHTHDEVLVECAEQFAAPYARDLCAHMEEGFDWSEGLPIKAETEVARWYTKSEQSWGL